MTVNTKPLPWSPTYINDVIELIWMTRRKRCRMNKEVQTEGARLVFDGYASEAAKVAWPIPLTASPCNRLRQ